MSFCGLFCKTSYWDENSADKVEKTLKSWKDGNLRAKLESLTNLDSFPNFNGGIRDLIASLTC